MKVYELIIFRAAKYASQAKVIFGVMNEVRNSTSQVIPQDVCLTIVNYHSPTTLLLALGLPRCSGQLIRYATQVPHPK